MFQIPFTEIRYHAITAVYREQVEYHNGLSGPALGYTWAEHAGGQMLDEIRQALHELWAANLVDIETHRLFAQRGHRVRITPGGNQLRVEWQKNLRQQLRGRAKRRNDLTPVSAHPS